jgi:hypothetical protein
LYPCPDFPNDFKMNGKNKILEDEIKQLLDESKAENDALKKLIAALKEEKMRNKEVKNIKTKYHIN